MSFVLIIGAKSDIAKDIAKIYAKNGYNLYLAGRNVNKLKLLKNDLKIRFNVKVFSKEFDVTNFESHLDFFSSLSPKPIGTIYIAGYMVQNKICEIDFPKSLNTINVNFSGAVSILNIVANFYEKQKKGFIIGISSVAGDRGRKSNYIYGASKAAFSAYLSGLRNRLYDFNVNVLTVKPGFVNTKMIDGLDLPSKLIAQTENVAVDIYKSQQKGESVIYTKKIWKFIMLIIVNIPENLFKRLSL